MRSVLPPDINVPQRISDIIRMVQTLVDNHYAYQAANGDVYYRVSAFPATAN